MGAKKITSLTNVGKSTEESTYVPSEKEVQFKQSHDPGLPFNAMGAFWGLLIGLTMVLTSILMVTHHVYSPKTSPPNLLIEGDKF